MADAERVQAGEAVSSCSRLRRLRWTAHAAERSPAGLFESLREADGDERIEDTTVLQPRELYEECQDICVTPTQLSVSLQQPMDLLAGTDLAYALTTYKVENLVKGYLFPSTTDLYIQPALVGAWTQMIEDRGLLGGGNTRVRVTDDHAFYRTAQRDSHTVVSTPSPSCTCLLKAGRGRRPRRS